jgi:hypothetical protein
VPDSLEVDIRSSDELTQSISEDKMVQKGRTDFEESIPGYGTFLLGEQTLSPPRNTMNTPVQQTFVTLPTQANSFSHYDISRTDPIVVTFDAEASMYWVVPTITLWMIVNSPGERMQSLNKYHAVANGDGTHTIVLSGFDSGV